MYVTHVPPIGFHSAPFHVQKSGLIVGGACYLLLGLPGEEVRREESLERVDGEGRLADLGPGRGGALHR
jgi:hypothetical protein